MAITFYRCPNCGASLGSRSGMQSGLYDIGKETITCACGTEIKTGGKEWNDSGGARKGWLYFKTYILQGVFPWSLLSLCAAFAFEIFVLEDLLDIHLEPVSPSFAVSSVSLLVGLALFCFIMYRVHVGFQEDIDESKRRG